MSNADQPAVSGGGRSRGRPSIGPSVLIRLPTEEKSFAEELGEGVAAKGVRRAVTAAGLLGLEMTLSMAGPDATNDTVKRGRGRPMIGKPLPVRLSEVEQQFADLLGTMEDGRVITAAGVRRALRACARMGIKATLRMVD